METLYYIILVPMVYVAVAVFVIGLIIRLIKVFKAPRNPSTLQIYPKKKMNWLGALSDSFLFPTVRRHKPLLWVFLILFHLGILALIIGHLQLFGKGNWFQGIDQDIFLGHGWLGAIVLVCLLFFILRRLKSPVRELSVPEDYLILLLLLLAAFFGSQMDWARTWFGYGELATGDYREYFSNLLLLHPEVPYNIIAAGHSFMLVLHVFFANLFLMLFPFSHLVHAIFSLPMNKLRRG